MGIGLFQRVSFAAILGPYFISFEGSDFGKNPNRFAIPELDCNLIFISFAARSFGSEISLLHFAFKWQNFVCEVSF